MSEQSRISFAVRRPIDGVGIIDVHGEVNAQAEEALMDAYADATDNNPRTIILNFTDLEYMNSRGIGLLVTLLIRVKRNGQRLLAYGLSDHYTQIFEVTRLAEAIQIFASEAEALKAAGMSRVR